MRVMLIADMEGISGITDWRECWPAFPEYWQTGRQKMTADVVAAARGLLEGGATAVWIHDGHGTGNWRNILTTELPDSVEVLGASDRIERFDAAFQVGLHARCGTPDGFISHTNVPEFRIRVNGALITESHDDAWTAGLPLLGITGDSTLGRELDGSLSDVAFLGVQRSTSRIDTTSIRDAAAIHEFASRCARDWRDAMTPRPPDTFTVEISLRPDLADSVYTGGKLTRKSDSVLTLQGADWRRDAKPGLAAAKQAALKPWAEAHGSLDLSSDASMLQQDPAALERMRNYIERWMHAEYPAWED